MNLLGVDQSLGLIFDLSVAIAIVLVLVVFLVAMYAYYRRRLWAVSADARDVADLAAMRDRYAAEIDQAKSWQADAKEEMLKLAAEREAQERLRQELNQAEQAVGDAQQRADDARKELLDLQHAVSALADDKERLTDMLSKLQSEREPAEKLATEARTDTPDL